VIASDQSTGIGAPYYGCVDGLLAMVTARFGVAVDGERIALVEGLFEHTVPRRLPQRIAYADVDCDWNDPVRVCLAVLAGAVSPGSVIVIDDCADYEGCRRVTDRFRTEHPDFRLVSPRLNAVIERR